MKKIKLSKIEHRGTERIKVLFEKKAAFIAKIKTIDGRRWSKTKNCWLLPYSKKSFDALNFVFGESNLEFPNKHSETKSAIEPQFVNYQRGGENFRKIIGEKIILKMRSPDWIEAYVPYHKMNWIKRIQVIEGRKWDVKKTAWVLPNVKTTFRHLKKQIGLSNFHFDFKIEKDIPDSITISKKKQRRKRAGYEALSEAKKAAIKKTEEQLILKRHSQWTIKSYRNHLIEIFSYFDKLPPEAIGSKEMQAYILHLIKFKKISESTQNQIINAYKAYVEKVLKRPKEYIEIPRPKRPKKLPDVLSTNEVAKIINSPKNLKHKLCLLLIYSAGLRRSELLNLRRADIHFDRRTMFVKSGKGKKDRYVVLAESAIPYLRKYLKVFDPVYWLVEGQNGGKYSVASLQKIFRKAVEQSKVNPYATLHTLRHSYATHCVEKGHNLKMVQEALGHSSLRTTEIYLHISSDALKKLKSPLDDLDIK